MNRNVTKTSTLAFVALLGAASADAAPRILTSSEGARTMEAEILDVYDTQGGLLVLLQTGDGRRMKAPASSFSDGDQEHFAELAILKAIDRSVSVKLEESVGEASRALSRGRRVTTEPTAFAVSVRNSGSEEVTDLELEYKIFYQKEVRAKDRDFRETRIAEGTLELPQLASLEAKNLETAAVEIISDRPNVGGPG